MAANKDGIQDSRTEDKARKGSAQVVERGSTVVLDYAGKFEDGAVFDSTESKAPIEFQAGDGYVIKGVDDAVIGMKKGEKKTVRISPEDGYGERDENLIQQVPRTVFPADLMLEPGMGFSFRTPEGQIIHATITSVSDELVTLDLNHPLAGRKLVFDIEVVEVK